MSHLPTMGGGSAPLDFPPAVKAHLGGHEMSPRAPLTKGFVSEDCHIAVVYGGPNLEVINPKNGERLAAWTFGSAAGSRNGSRKTDSTGGGGGAQGRDIGRGCEITACVEISPNNRASRRPAGEKSNSGRFLAVGLNNGYVCLFDVRSSTVVRCVKMPHHVTALASIASSTSIPRFLAEEWLLFHGLIAVGSQEGHVYLIDMATDEDCQELASDEASPSEPYFTDLASGDTEKLATIRSSATYRGQHVCVLLGDQTKRRPKVFDYTDSLRGETTYFPEAGVVVSSLTQVPQLGALLVGYNFGAWQLWNISAVNSQGNPHSLDFSSPYESDALPVVAFTFQEPENDPRNFAYIWAVRGESDLDTSEEKQGLSTKASMSLFALAFQNKDDNDAGVLYSGLTACHQRFEYEMGSHDPTTSSKGSLCLAGATLAVGAAYSNANSALDKRDISEVDSGQNLGLCAFLWEVLDAPTTGSQATEEGARFYLGIFDLNAWYQAQMPNRVELEPATQCSYLSVCSLDDVLPEDNRGDLVHCRIDLATLSRYQSLSNAEQHFYPSSLAFNVICLLDDAVVHAIHLGLQRKVLLELRSRGRDSLVEPGPLYRICVIAGLVDDTGDLDLTDSHSPSEGELKHQRAVLLTVSLEHHLVDFLKGCILHWSDGKS
jgi:hypothetical protein